MSVRRLAKEQPKSFAFSKETMKLAQWWIAKYPTERKQSAVIPILWLVQKQEGWVCEPAIRAIAEYQSFWEAHSQAHLIEEDANGHVHP